MNKIGTLLSEFGLNKQEITIYTYLVGKEELTAYKIAKATGIHRSTTYDILERLNNKGIVYKQTKKFTYYGANEISTIIAQLKDREAILTALLPEINKLFTTKPQARILEDIGGQKQFNYHLFQLAKEKKITFCYIIGNTHATTMSGNVFIQHLIKEITPIKKIDYKGIWDNKYKKDKIIKLYTKLGPNKFLSLPSKTGIVIYDEGIAFMFTEGKPYVIDIKVKMIAEEMKNYFIKLWTLAEK